MSYAAAHITEQSGAEVWDAAAVSCGRGARDGSALVDPTVRFQVVCDARFHSLHNAVHAGGTDYLCAAFPRRGPWC